MKTEQYTISNEDNMKLMARYPDNHFDLSICDPPYGIDVNMNAGKKKGEKDRYKKKKWDKGIPDEIYFNELQRVSKNQIMWGCNYFNGYLWSAGRISWFKNNGAGNDFSDCELAMHTFNNRVTNVSVQWSGFISPPKERGIKRIHPTQKPITLYEWLFKNYSEPNQKILDTHLGSGSIAIALDNMNKFDKMNLHLTACELDKEYFDAACERIDKQTRQHTIFD